MRQTIACICPKNLEIHFDDIEQEALVRLWRATEAEREINFLSIRSEADATQQVLEAWIRV